MCEKRTLDSKSAHQITLETTETRKNVRDVIRGHWPRMTSVDLKKVTRSVQTMTSTWKQLSICKSPTKTPNFSSYRLQNAAERKFHLTWPWEWRHRSRVIGGRVTKFSGKMSNWLLVTLAKFGGATRRRFWVIAKIRRGGRFGPPNCRTIWNHWPHCIWTANILVKKL